MAVLIMNEWHNLLYFLSALLLFLILSPKSSERSRTRKALYIGLLLLLSLFYIGYEDVDPFLYTLNLIPLAIMFSIILGGYVTSVLTWLIFNFCSFVFYDNPLLPVMAASALQLLFGLLLYYRNAFDRSFPHTVLWSSAMITAYVIPYSVLYPLVRPIPAIHYVITAVIGTYFIGVIVNYVYFQIQMQERLKEDLIRSEKNHIVSQLTAAISHEIRNPLTTVRGFIQLMSKKDLTPDQRISYTRYALEGIDQANGIITDYLSFARPSIERKRRIALQDEVQFILPLVQPLALLSNVQIVWEQGADEQPAYIWGESNKLQQILLNVIKNAIEAMPEGGSLTISIRPVEDEVIITIRDTGTGMTKEQIARIGMPFYTTKEKGTGLGLMVVISLMQAMNGRLEIQSTSSQGTSCMLRFKRAESSSNPS
ncbi:ATP-binding protein [Paenibacillus sp. PL2-23]|uniref:ATP-binding protein n=1 Tax=Paenibacillus sp. PL2-23 TaxID=2100729 RepID=UPI0030F550C0